MPRRRAAGICNIHEIVKASLVPVSPDFGRPIRRSIILRDISDQIDAHLGLAVMLTAPCAGKAKIAQMRTRFERPRPAQHAVL